jgi:hypothetical protein
LSRHSSTRSLPCTMSRLVAGVILCMTRVQLAVASMDTSGRPMLNWKLVTSAVVPRGLDPLVVLEKLLSTVGEVDTILIHQPEARSVLLRRFAQYIVVLVQPPHAESRVLWTPLVPKDWAPLLMAQWRVVDLVYTHARREYQAAAIGERSAGASSADFFEQLSTDQHPVTRRRRCNQDGRTVDEQRVKAAAATEQSTLNSLYPSTPSRSSSRSTTCSHISIITVSLASSDVAVRRRSSHFLPSSGV